MQDYTEPMKNKVENDLTFLSPFVITSISKFLSISSIPNHSACLILVLIKYVA